MKAIMAMGCGSLEIHDIAIPKVQKQWVLAKVYAFSLGSVERAIQRCKILVPYGRIIGSEGILKIFEVGIEVEHNIRGRLCIVNPLCKEKFLGIDLDGVAAEYVAIPKQCLELLPKEYETNEYLERLPILKTITLGLFVAKESKDQSLLIVGSGFSAYTAAYIAKEKSTDIAFISSSPRSQMSELGIRSTSKSLKYENFDVIYISSFDKELVNRAIKSLKKDGKLILHPAIPYSIEFRLPPRDFKIVIAKYGRVSEGLNILNEVYSRLRKHIHLSNSFEEALYSRSLASIVILRSF